MNLFRQSLKLVLPALVLNTFFASAQKLPNVQTTSLYAPADIKINGKTNEWNDNFKAYNKAVEIYYTLSNDDTNLYLTAKVKEREVIDKLIRGGISLIINREDVKSKIRNVKKSLTKCPDFSHSQRPQIIIKKGHLKCI